MPPLPLTTLLQAALPELSTRTRAVLSTLGCYNGDVPAAGEVATLVGMRSRFQLARTLRQEGLPPFEELAGWARVLYWGGSTWSGSGVMTFGAGSLASGRRGPTLAHWAPRIAGKVPS